MGTENLEFSDVSHSESTSLARINGGSTHKGFVVTPVVIFIYVLITICLAVGVGLIVHFCHPGGDCRCDCAKITTTVAPTEPATTPDGDLAWELCYNLSVARNECLPCPPGGPDTPPLPTSAPAITGLRLPDTLIPYHYNVEVKPDIYKDDPYDFDYEGWVDIYLECADPTNLVVLQYRMMTLDDDSLRVTDVDNGEELDVTHIDRDEEREFYNVTLDQGLTAGQKIVVSIEYKGPLSSSNSGMFWNVYYVDGEARYGLMTQFESTDARKAFPCLDEPHLKATFNITLWRKASPMVALSNMPIDETVDKGDGWFSERYLPTPVVMPTYLIAFGIANFTYVEANSAGGNYPPKTMRFYAPPDAIQDGHADYIASKEGIMFDYFEDLFDHQFALPKLDSITINEFSSGAMENWGLVTYRETRLLWDQLYSTEYERQRLMGTNAHELLHMWLGNVVTCKWWDDIWLQEAMARYHQHGAMKEAEPNWDIDQVYTAQVMVSALGSDSTGRSHPIYNPTVETPAEIDSMFSSISYDKGGSVIRMMHRLVMGDDYILAMRDYVDTLQYSNAEHDDLLEKWDYHVDPAALPANRDLTNIMYTWIKQMGFPVLTFDRQGDEVKVTQEMFLLDPGRPIEEEYPSDYGYKWDIPVTYITSADTSAVQTEWFLYDDVDGLDLSHLPASFNWVLGNPGWQSFSRVNYDEQTWGALIEQLNADHLVFQDPVDRGRLIDDSMQLARAGLLDQTIALDTTKYLLEEDSYIAWYLAERGLAYIGKIFNPISEYALLMEYIRNLAEPKYEELGWDYQAGEDLMTNYLRGKILDLSCKYWNADCLLNVTTLFEAWRQNPTDMTIIKPEVRSLVYCTHIRHAHSDSWDFLFEQYGENWHSGPDGVERGKMRDALGCATQRWTLDRYFRLAAEGDESIFHNDRTSVMRAVARNPVGKHVAWDYLSGHWHTMISRTTILNDVVSHFSTEFELEKLQTHITKHPPVSVSEMGRYEDALYTVKANIRWRQENENKVIDWLQAAVLVQNKARAA